jgi:outer membrane lipoprotein-sorting protein
LAGNIIGNFGFSAGSAFDGNNLWFYSVPNVVKTDTSGNIIATFNLGIAGSGALPGGMAFDGEHMWIINPGYNTAIKVNTDGHVLATYSVGLEPTDIAFDGTHMWVSSFELGNLTRL